MLITAAQMTAFFSKPGQMALPAATRIAIAQEGLKDLADLVEFDDQSLKQITDNLRRPGGRVPDPNPNANAGATITTPAFVFGAKSQLCLKAACDISRYYETTVRDLSSGNMRWNPVIKTFTEHWKSLTALQDWSHPMFYLRKIGGRT